MDWSDADLEGTFHTRLSNVNRTPAFKPDLFVDLIKKIKQYFSSVCQTGYIQPCGCASVVLNNCFI